MAETAKNEANKGFREMLRKLEMTEKRQAQALDDTRKQIEAIKTILK